MRGMTLTGLRIMQRYRETNESAYLARPVQKLLRSRIAAPGYVLRIQISYGTVQQSCKSPRNSVKSLSENLYSRSGT